MLTNVTITDNKNTPIGYLPNVFDNCTSFDFKPGVNIIIGENGSGKSTLLKLIAKYSLCDNGMISQMPDKSQILKIDSLFNSRMFDSGENSMKDGCKVKMDYNSIVFRYSPSIEQKHSEDVLDSNESFVLFMSSLRGSMGEGMLFAFNALIKKMNEQKDVNFPLKTIEEYSKSCNDVWSERMNMMLQYYADNHVDVSQDDFEYTVLLDEPDRNLDIKHIKELYNILSFHRPMTQLVVVVHNPVLIYKLMQTDVNFVEMTPNYLDKVKNFIRWAK